MAGSGNTCGRSSIISARSWRSTQPHPDIYLPSLILAIVFGIRRTTSYIASLGEATVLYVAGATSSLSQPVRNFTHAMAYINWDKPPVGRQTYHWLNSSARFHHSAFQGRGQGFGIMPSLIRRQSQVAIAHRPVQVRRSAFQPT